MRMQCVFWQCPTDDGPTPQQGIHPMCFSHSLAVKPILKDFFKMMSFNLYYVNSSIQNKNQKNFEICSSNCIDLSVVLFISMGDNTFYL